MDIDFHANNGDQCEETSPVEEEHRQTDVEMYMSHLSEKGTTDSDFILSYMDISAKKIDG